MPANNSPVRDRQAEYGTPERAAAMGVSENCRDVGAAAGDEIARALCEPPFCAVKHPRPDEPLSPEIDYGEHAQLAADREAMLDALRELTGSCKPIESMAWEPVHA